MKFWILILAAAVISPGGVVVAQESEAGQDAGQQESTEDDRREVRRLQDLVGGEGEGFSMDLPQLDMPQTPAEEQPDVTLPDEQLDDRLQNILAQRAFNPDNPDIEQQLSDVLDDVEARAREAMAAGDLDLAERYSVVLVEFDDQRDIVGEINAERQRIEETARVLGLADQALASSNLLEPADASAWVLYQRALELDPDNAEAEAGLTQVRTASLEQFDQLLADSDFEAAGALLDQLGELEIEQEQIDERRAQIVAARADQRRSMISAARTAIDNEEFDAAERAINDLIAFGAESQVIAQLRSSLEDAERYAGFEPGQLFQDGLDDGDRYGPVMIVVPSGSFLMGSPESERDRIDNEGPRFRVTFDRGFALGRTEVTVAEFGAFVDATGFVTDAERRGSSRVYITNTGSIAEREGVTWRDDFKGDRADGNLPVTHVSWNDASAYVEWLARETERAYRLPSEAEFEYALRAGSQTRYWWGDDRPRDPVENVTGDGDRFTGGRTWDVSFRRYSDGFWGPAPVGSLEANPFGLFDMGGNIMEWMEDCWHDSFVRAPTDGDAWVNPGCSRRVIRGAQWSSTPEMSRSAYRLSATAGTTDARVGFRVARDL